MWVSPALPLEPRASAGGRVGAQSVLQSGGDSLSAGGNSVYLSSAR